MSAWITFVNIGAHSNFFSLWMHAWFLAWPAAGIIAFISGPFIHKLAQRIAEKL
ncbi:DUF2798 domain-containing protein [Halomonas neptunia]|uniref:DUF2798 domain-containing protein n=2 Tax=Vreelandella neptunia TaxID=115551 RepID=A0ABS9S8H8_9GAMM|nr:DUF2798 domain-containing protein [Halomonas neptunia]